MVNQVPPAGTRCAGTRAPPRPFDGSTEALTPGKGRRPTEAAGWEPAVGQEWPDLAVCSADRGGPDLVDRAEGLMGQTGAQVGPG